MIRWAAAVLLVAALIVYLSPSEFEESHAVHAE